MNIDAHPPSNPAGDKPSVRLPPFHMDCQPETKGEKAMREHRAKVPYRDAERRITAELTKEAAPDSRPLVIDAEGVFLPRAMAENILDDSLGPWVAVGYEDEDGFAEAAAYCSLEFARRLVASMPGTASSASSLDRPPPMQTPAASALEALKEAEAAITTARACFAGMGASAAPQAIRLCLFKFSAALVPFVEWAEAIKAEAHG